MAKNISQMRRIEGLLAEYGESHRNSTNKLIHWICVPVIAWTVLALLWSLPFPAITSLPYVNWATIVALLAIIYYLSLSVPLAVGMAVFSAIAFWLILAYEANSSLPLYQFALAVFAIAWVFQFIGHKIEGKKPSFFKDVQFLLIGPAWLMHFLFRRLGIPY